MVTKEQARAIAVEHLLREHPGGDVAIVDVDTIERGYGWVFFYNSKRFLSTENVSYALAGNGPLVVNKVDGSVHQLGSALDIEQTLRQFELTEKRRLDR